MALTNGRLVLETDPARVAAITLRNKFLRWKGSWFLDTEEGIPYLRHVLKKGADLGVVRKIFEKVILGTAFVASIESLSLSLSSTRVLLLDFRAICEDGRAIVGGIGDRFVVEVEE
jgi:hypothetical protein